MLAKAIKLGVLSTWPPCIRLCGLLPESVVRRSGRAREAGLKKQRRKLNRVSRHWEPTPREAQVHIELALMGHQWAAEDTNPLEQFAQKLHGMFLAVLRARNKWED